MLTDRKPPNIDCY